MNLEIIPPSDNDLEQVYAMVKAFVLDDEDLEKEQFLVAKHEGEVLGFGRLRDHGDALELCTLGVAEEHRGKGIGRAIVNALLQKTKQPVHVVCIIPCFFQKFGFKEVDRFPLSMARKHFLCTTEYVVPETYFVMELRQ